MEESVDMLLDRLADLPGGHPCTWDLHELRTGIPALFELGHQLAALQNAAIASYDTRGAPRSTDTAASRQSGAWFRGERAFRAGIAGTERDGGEDAVL